MDIQINSFYNCDCMELMANFPDNFVDLAIVDPPYGIGIGNMSFTNGKQVKTALAKRNDYSANSQWDNTPPSAEYFNELFRVSKNQIIWGGNYFTDKLPPTKSWIIWDKRCDEKFSNDGIGILDAVAFNIAINALEHQINSKLPKDCNKCFHSENCFQQYGDKCKSWAEQNGCKNFHSKDEVYIIPLKPGDVVYSYCEELHRPLAYKIETIFINFNRKISFEAIAIDDENDELLASIDFDFSDYGKDVFKTEDEAIKGKKNENT